MALQLSEAEAPPCESSQAWISPEFPEPSHSMSILEASVSITGAVVSLTVMFCDTEALLPQASVNVHVRVIRMLQGSASSTVSTPVAVMSPAQLSVAVRSPGAGTSAEHW